MDIREIELMKSLQRRYYDELNRSKSLGEIRVNKCKHNPQILFLYRLCMVFTFAVIFAVLIHKF
jgi:hypothetical protein